MEGRDFEIYLPQDNEETSEADTVIQLISFQLKELLQLDSEQFWCAVSKSPSLGPCLQSYLQHARRPHDFNTPSLPPSLLRQQLAKDIFLVFHRLVQSCPAVPFAQQKDILSKSRLLEVPHLLDFSTLYMPNNASLVQGVLQQVHVLRPDLLDSLKAFSSRIVGSMNSVCSTCEKAAVELIVSGDLKTFQGLSDGLAYLYDCCKSLSCLLSVFQPGAYSLLDQGIAKQLGRIYDSLVVKGVTAWSTHKADPSLQGVCQKVQARLYWLSEEVKTLLFTLLSQACLKNAQIPARDTYPPGFAPTQANGRSEFAQSKSSVPSPGDKGGLLHSILLSSLAQAVDKNKTSRLAGNMNKTHGIDTEIELALSKGILQLDLKHQGEIAETLGSSIFSSTPRHLTHIGAGPSQTPSEAAKKQAIQQVREVLPNYGEGFISVCLDSFQNDPQIVLQHILENSLPDFLQNMDLKHPLSEPSSAHPQVGTTEIAAHEARARDPQSGPSGLKWREMEDVQRATAGLKIQEGPTLSSSQQISAPHKGTARALQATDQEKAIARLHAQAAQWEEYEDEYDDSYDDLAGYDADPNADPLGDEAATSANASYIQRPITSRALPGNSSQLHTMPKGGKPLWVLNGRIYNHRKEGATPAPNQAAAEELLRASEDEIHGLGQGGNKALHLPRTQDDRGNSGQPADQGRSGGQGMGRGGRKGYSDMRQARQFKDMNKAAIGNHHRKDRALKKTGGPAM